MKRIQFTIAFITSSFALSAQTIFLNTVKIEFEKTVYLRQLYKEFYPPQTFEMVKNQIPETFLSYFDFIGDTTKSLFKPGRQVAATNRNIQPFANENVVFTDYTSQKVITQKQVFEETFLLEDSLTDIEWKMTGDTRVIAGFECKKAVGILHDSIAIFAFYCDELLISGGPESIRGLPGMILGMGIPRLHTTWFATKVEMGGNVSSVKPATKGKKVTYKTMVDKIHEVLKAQRGNYSSIAIAFII